MNKKSYLIAVLGLVLAISGGIYAYTYTTAIGTISIAEPTGDIATCNETPTQPDWEDVLDTEQDTETLRPNASGTYTQCTPVGDTPNYLCVDEEVADDDSTYISTSIFGSTDQTDTYNIPDHSEGSGTITSVTVYLRSRATYTANLHAVEPVIRTYNTNYYGTYTLLPLTYTNYLTTNTTNPYTTNAWTWAEIDALQIGARQYDNGYGGAYTTQVYVEIDYQYLPITGNVPTGDLFEVYEHPDYSSDLNVRVYLTNTAALMKAYDYLDMELYLEDSEEAGETPNYQLLTLENGVATFTLKDPVSDNHTLSVIGGDYGLVSDNTSEWEEGWTVTPELYCEATQR